MSSRAKIAVRSVLFASAFALAACGSGSNANLAEMDNALLGNGADPALTSALEDQILTDPNLSQQSNANAVRRPERPAHHVATIMAKSTFRAPNDAWNGHKDIALLDCEVGRRSVTLHRPIGSVAGVAWLHRL